jgi:hypothetical protein
MTRAGLPLDVVNLASICDKHSTLLNGVNRTGKHNSILLAFVLHKNNNKTVSFYIV